MTAPRALAATGFEKLPGICMKYQYPDAGGLPAPTGCRLIILTAGGADIMGQWSDDGGFLAWCRLPERCRVTEDLLRDSEIERVSGILL